MRRAQLEDFQRIAHAVFKAAAIVVAARLVSGVMKEDNR
jgi:hypothetical protein